jgi:hypothetical protein
LSSASDDADEMEIDGDDDVKFSSFTFAQLSVRADDGMTPSIDELVRLASLTMLAFLISSDAHDVEFFKAGASIFGAMICGAGFAFGLGFC